MSGRERRSTNRMLALLGSIAVLALTVILWRVVDEAITDLVVYVPADMKGVTAANWVDELRGAGFHVHVVKEPDPERRRNALHIPPELAAQVSAVTANPSRYVLSGYVPPHAIARLLSEQPSLHGLSVADSPELTGAMDDRAPISVDVWAHWSEGRRQLYMRANHARER